MNHHKNQYLNQTISHFDINPAEVMAALNKNTVLLSAKNQEYLRLSQQYAESKEVYSIALSQKLLELRAVGEPVSIVKDLARGDRNVAGLEKNMIKAEAIMKACQQSMHDIRSEQDVQRSLLSWLKTEIQNQ